MLEEESTPEVFSPFDVVRKEKSPVKQRRRNVLPPCQFSTLQQDLITESSQLFQPTKLDPLGLNVIGQFLLLNK